MHYRTLGRTDIQVSLICLGTMTFGEQNSEAEAHQQLDYAVERGINFIDTAELYAVPSRAETYGLTEQYIGTWLAKRQDREKLILASKVAGPDWSGDWIPHIRKGPRLNREHIRAACHASLKRLQTDYIDLYQVHWPERKTNFFGKLNYPWPEEHGAIQVEETLQALAELVDEGKVRHIGLSNETPWGVAEYLRLSREQGLPRIVSIQNPYSLLNRSFEVGLAEFAHHEQVGLLAYSPLAFGALSGKYLRGGKPEGARLTRWTYFDRYNNREAVAATEEYVELAKARGIDPAQMALAFVNSRPFTTSTIIGATTMAQLESNIASLELELDDELFQALEDIHKRWPTPSP